MQDVAARFEQASAGGLTMTSPLSGLRVLIVEDEALVAMMAEDMLSDLGCVVVDVAGTVSQGLAIAGDDSRQVDTAVLDVNLGGETVYPVAEALKARGVPFIFATGYAPSSISRSFAHVPVLAKPYRLDALEERLVSAIEPRPAS